MSLHPRSKRTSVDPTMGLDPGMEDEINAEVAGPGGMDDEMRDMDLIMEDMLDKMDKLLPDIEAPEGFHVCWLSTTNERDSIGQRERWGYTPCMISELPAGQALPTDIHSAGVGDGMIRVREMILYKIPLMRAEAIMRIHHHKRPNEMAEALDPARQQRLIEIRDRTGSPLIRPEGDGLRSASWAPNQVPTFLKPMRRSARP